MLLVTGGVQRQASVGYAILLPRPVSIYDYKILVQYLVPSHI